MEGQVRAGTTRTDIAREWARRFPGEKPLGNRTYTRIRSFVKASDDLAEVIESGKLRGGPADIEYSSKRRSVTLYGDPQADRMMVSGTVKDETGSKHFNYSARPEDLAREDVAETAVDVVEGVYSTGDSGPLADRIEDPEDELGHRIEVTAARRVVADAQTRRRRR